MITEQDRQKAEQLITQAKYAVRGDPTQARRLAMSAARLDPSSEQPWLIMASLAAPKARIAYLEKALAANPKSEAARDGLERENRRLGRLSEVPTQPVKVSALRKQQRAFPFIVWSRKSRTDSGKQNSDEPAHMSTLSRVAQYALVRAAALGLTLVASLFLIIYIVNLGGNLDTLIKGGIAESLAGLSRDAALHKVPPEQIQQMVEQARWAMEEAYGLHQPFLSRCAGWLYRGLTLDWGKARFFYVISSDFGQETVSNDIREVILGYLPRTLLLLGVSNFGIFLISVLLAILLTRSPGSWLNKLVMALAPTSAAPGWFYGLILYALSYKVLGIYNFQLGFSNWPTRIALETVPVILRGMALPFLAIFISKFFQSVYAWRTYFMVYMREDYVELARAKGLPAGLLERRYLVRPALPSIITSFALIVVGLWQECIAVEYFFQIQGIGGLFVQALQQNDIAVIVSLVSIFAYFLTLTVFFLEIIYVLIDPRVKIEKENVSSSPRHLSGHAHLALTDLRSWFQAIRFQRPTLAGNYAFSRKKSLAPRKMPQPSPGPRAAQAIKNELARFTNACQSAAREISPSPMAICGTTIILVLTGLSFYTVLAIPYGTAIRQWRGDDNAWIKNPVQAPPTWTNLFRREKLPETILVNSKQPGNAKIISTGSKGTLTTAITLPFDYSYDTVPQDIMVQFSPRFKTMKPFVQVSWITPDGREISFKNFSVTTDTNYYPTKDPTLERKLKRTEPMETLFMDSSGSKVVKGRYAL